MATRLIGPLSRLAFLVCGIISVMLSNIYRSLQGLRVLPNSELRLFSTVLTVAGAFSVVIAVLPNSWVEKACKIEPGKLSSVPIKMLGGFAVFSYLLPAGFYFAPHSWHPSPQLAFSVCPACALTITVDPSLVTFLLLLAPLNAAVYGSLGAAVGYVLVIPSCKR